ncbi:hypothetical protein [Posidoniimonas corsicana]|nr:hypothetical protein [Posidoniimonas corsicana]
MRPAEQRAPRREPMVDRPRLKTPFDTPPRAAAPPPDEAAAGPPSAPPAPLSPLQFRLSAVFSALFVVSVATAGYTIMRRYGQAQTLSFVLALLLAVLLLALGLLAAYLYRRRGGRAPAFTTRGFFALTFLLAAAAAGYGGMAKQGESHAFYVTMTLMTPLVVLVAAAAARQLAKRRRRPPPTDASPFDS